MENDRILIFFDLETTGLDPDSDDVIEIGAIKTKDGEIVEEFSSFVKPRKSISRFITNLTGITEEDLKKAKDVEEIKEKINSFIRNYPLIAHNAYFDKMFLEKLLNKAIENEVFDTLEISRIFFPELKSHSLQNLIKKLSLKKENSHRALSDTLMLVSLFEKIEIEKEKYPKEFLKKIKKIIEPNTDYTSLFGKNWEDSKNDEETKIFETQSSNLNTLPFKENPQPASTAVNKLFYVDSASIDDTIEEVVRLLKDDPQKQIVQESISKDESYKGLTKVVLSVYSNDLRSEVSMKLSNKSFHASNVENSEKLLCPKKIQFFLDNSGIIPTEYKINFAILVSYLFRTKDISLSSAPTHIMKNPLIRILSFCDEPFDTCKFKNQCPLFKKLSEIKSSDVVIVNHQFAFNSSILRDELNGTNLLFLEAYRLPKVLYSAKIGLSLSDINMFASYHKIKNEDREKIKIIYESFENTTIKDYSKELEELKKIFVKYKNDVLKKFFERETFFLDKKGNKTVLFGASESPKSAFEKITKKFNSIELISKENNIGDRLVLKSFTGVEGKHATIGVKKDREDIISLVPLFLPSTNNSSFPEEFTFFFGKVHKPNVKAAIIFNQQNLLKEVYFNFKRTGLIPKAYGIDLQDENKEIEMFLYDILPSNTYDEVYFVKLPSIQSENFTNETFEYYSALLLKNYAKDLTDKNPHNQAFFYFDNKLRSRDYRIKYEDLFISFPLFLEREESLFKMLETWSRRHHLS